MLTTLQATLARQGYKTLLRPFELNIVGVRSKSTTPNSFDDAIHVFYKNAQGAWILQSFKATTDPGTFWLKNPSNPQGTAILKAGQYLEAYMIGMHRGKYIALIQRKPVTVMRDYDRNAVLDFANGKEEKGLFGINIHRALEAGKTLVVEKYSAGCQVFAGAGDFNLFMQLCERHKQLYGNVFTYTLIDERAMDRELKKNS